VEPPQTPGSNVTLRLRLDGKMRGLVRSDATVQIVNEGMLGGKVVEIEPGSTAAKPADDNAQLASKPSSDLTDVLSQVKHALEGMREGQGSLGKLLRAPEAYRQLVAALQQSRDTPASFQQDADAIKRLPVVRGYIEDPEALLVRPNCERNRQCF